MAVELAAGALLTVAFEKLVERLTSREFFNFFKGKKSIDSQLGLLTDKLKTASPLLNDAEDRQIYEPNVKEWLEELKDIIFKAEDLVEDINDEARTKEECEPGSRVSVLVKSIFQSEFDKNVPAELANILKDLNSLLERARDLGLKRDSGGSLSENTRSSSSRLTAPLLEESRFHGRSADKEEILKFVLSDDQVWGNKIGVLPIVGMGGLGKTTLAQQVFDDRQVEEQGFQLKAWVTVSTEFDIRRIMNTILQKVNQRDIKESAELQRQLKEALKGKKFLFVLDDVWDKSYERWDALKSAFASGDCKSKIIVTTRSRDVALIARTGTVIHELQPVSNDYCWKIFLDHACDVDPIKDPDLLEIGKKIVEKCKGVPLAVKSIGGLLRSNRKQRKWKSILESPVWKWSENESNVILPSLWLSYRDLPPCLKRCFAYCSMFPQDYLFKKEEIILLWMAEGFLLTNEKEKRMEEVGEEYFNDLIARSLFQRPRYTDPYSAFVMHDLVHELATFVYGAFCFRFDHSMNVERLTKKTRHLLYEVSIDEGQLRKGGFEAKHLRTFKDLRGYQFDYDSDEFVYDERRRGRFEPKHLHNKFYFVRELVKEVLEGGRYLRVLSLSPNIDIQMLSDSFSNLKHLRYLDLSKSEVAELPCSICTLYNLQTLLLSRCENLTQLPKDMGRLIHLRHLDITDTPLQEMPPQMGNLKELEKLTDFVVGKHGNVSSIEELGALQHLGGKLRISGLQNVHNVDNIHQANYLTDKEKLNELTLVWEDEVTDTRIPTEALRALQPHTNLTRLDIRRYAGINFPDWLGDSSFSKMESIYLSGNEYCMFLPPLGQLPSLRELVIESFHAVEKIGPEFFTGNSTFSITPFKCLEFLSFSDMQSWKEWSFVGQDGKGDGCFPRLEMLYFDRCPNLAGSLPNFDTVETLEICSSCKSLPLDNFPKLKELTLWRCESLKELIGDSPDVIETLHIEECNKLEFPGSHRYVHVKELKIDRGCDSVKTLPFDYFPRLEELDLKGCQNLESLTFTEETCIALQSLRIEDCKNLRSLPEHMHRLLPSLSRMRMSDCPEIEAFPEEGLPSNLKMLEIEKCCKLVAQSRHWNLQGLTSLRSLKIRDCEDIMLDSFPEGLLPSSLTSFTLSGFPHLKSLNGSAFQNVTCLEDLWLVNCKELQLLPREVLLPASLRFLWIARCPFLERSYQEGKGEDWHQIFQIPKIHIFGDTTDELERNKEEGSTSTNVKKMNSKCI